MATLNHLIFKKHEDKINLFLSSLLQNKAINKAMYDHLRIPSSRPGILRRTSKNTQAGCSFSSHHIFSWS